MNSQANDGIAAAQDTEEDESKKLEKRPGTGSMTGQFYEILTMLLLLVECEKRKREKKILKYFLTTNMSNVGCFDDVVLMCELPDGSREVIFIQTKHKDLPQKEPITLNELCSENKTFSLNGYLQSFLLIMKLFSNHNIDHEVFKGRRGIQDCFFVIFTNNSSHFNTGDRNFFQFTVRDELLLSALNNNCYKMSLSGNQGEILKNYLINSSSSYKLAKELAKSICDGKELNFNRGILKKYKNALLENVILVNITQNKEGKFKDAFVEQSNQNIFKTHLISEIQKRRPSLKPAEKLQDISLIFSEKLVHKANNNEDTNLPCDEISDEDLDCFLEKLHIFTNQSNVEELKQTIKDKIRHMYFLSDEETEIKYSLLEIAARDIWQGKDTHLDETNHLLDDILGEPIMYDVSDPVPLFIERESKMQELIELMEKSSSSATVLSHSISICGLGGIGKTECARRYIVLKKNSYRNIIWINSENRTSLEKSFETLAQDVLKIKIYNINNTRKDMNVILYDVYKHLSSRKTLIIFDNIENSAMWLEFRPKQKIDHLFMLITSRDRGWTEIPMLDLGVFTQPEAKKFLSKGLKLQEEDLDNADTENLLEILSLFPLALSQAVQYILRLQEVRESYTIKNYIDDFDKKKITLLNTELPWNTHNRYEKTIYTTWSVSVDEIKRDQRYGNLACRILNIIAYLAPNNIQTAMFTSLADDEDDLMFAVLLLVKYSIINGMNYQSVLSVHSLVQEVNKLAMIDQQIEKDVLNDTLQLLQNVTEENLDHAMHAWQSATKYKCLVTKYCNIFFMILKELPRAGRFSTGYEFGSKIIVAMQSCFIENDETIILSQYWNVSILYHWGKFSEAYQSATKLDKIATQFLGYAHNSVLLIKRLIGGCLMNLTKAKEALEILRKVLTIEESNFNTENKDNKSVLATKRYIGKCLITLGKYEEAFKIHNEIYESLKEKYDEEHPLILKAIANLAECHRHLGEYDIALSYLERVLKNLHKLKGNVQRYNNSTGHCFLNQGMYHQAQNKFTEVLTKYVEIYGEDHPISLATKQNLAICLNHIGNYEEANKLFHEILECKEKSRGKHDASTLKIKHCIGSCLLTQGKYDDAYRILCETLEEKLKTIKLSHPSTLKTKFKIAECTLYMKKYEEARKQCDEILSLQEDILTPHNPRTLITKRTKAICLIHENDLTNAEQLLEETIENQKSRLRDNSPEVLLTQCVLAKCYMKQNDMYKALGLLEYVLKHQVDILGLKHPNTIETKRILGKCYYKSGRVKDALKMFEETLDIIKNTLPLGHPTIVKMEESINLCNLMETN